MITEQEFIIKSEPFLKEYAKQIFGFGKEQKEYQQKTWRASSLGSCLRGVYLGRKGELKPRPLEERVKGIFYEGKMKELEMILQHILSGNEIVDSQSSLYNKELDATGHPDLIVKESGQILVEEIKTVNSRAFWYRMKDNIFHPYEHHVLQLTFYLHELQEEYPGINGRLRYRSKDDGTTILVPVPYQEDIWAKIRAELLVLNSCWQEGILPPVPETVLFDEQKKRYVVNYKAQYCDYHHHCLENPDWEKKALVEVKKLNEDQKKQFSNMLN